MTLGAGFFAPFFVGDLLLLGAAGLIWQQANRPMTTYEVAGFAACVALGAVLGVWPFVLRQRAELKLAETAELTDTLGQIQTLEDAAHRIAAATGQWQNVQEYATRAVTAAREIAERMTAEQKEFRAFLEQASHTEREHLRLEVNKLRRAEGDWLQVLVRVMDHVYVLYAAGVRSGQANLIEQLGQFQHACRDAARRVGLVPIAVPPGTTFDPELHQLPDPNAAVPDEAVVADTLATGFTFQGQLLRRVLVVLQAPPLAVTRPLSTESFSSSPAPNEPAPAPTAAIELTGSLPRTAESAPAPTENQAVTESGSAATPETASETATPPPALGQEQLPL